MISPTDTWRQKGRWWLLVLSTLIAGAMAAPAAETVPAEELNVMLTNARTFLRTRQDEQGAFGTVQPHLQTGLAVLALLSLDAELSEQDRQIVEQAVEYLVRSGSRSGDLGDDEYRTESHAIASLAALCALPRLPESELRTQVAERVYRAFRMTQRMQDRSSSGASSGGWKMEGFKGRGNDRRASAWALFAYDAANAYGLDLDAANVERGAGFMRGAFKVEAENADQHGGFSVDTEGLAVASISAMGTWVLTRLQPDAERANIALAWLHRHPPVWSGPNYFYTNFFRVRALKFAELDRREQYQRCRRQVFLQLRENQLPDGSFAFPPGNAQNTVAMGPVFATSMAVLILNIDDSRLVTDEDHRVPPLF